MESTNCSFSGCFSKITSYCKGDHPVQGYCEEHFKLHTLGSGQHSLYEPEAQIQYESRVFDLTCKSEARTICNFGAEAYLFTVNSISIPIPRDYYVALESLAKILSGKIVQIKPGETEKLRKKFTKFVNACIQVVYNLDVEFDLLFNELDRIFNDMYAKVSDFNIESINALLNEAQRFYEMKETAKKKFVFTLNIVDERQKFIEPFMSGDTIDMAVFEKSFMDIFSYFIQDRKKDFSNFFKNFERDLNRKKKILKEEYEKNFFSALIGYLTSTIQYTRVGVFCCKLTDDYRICEDASIPWTMAGCLVLQQCQVALSRPVELSQTELLIPLHVGHNSYILYYSGIHAPSLVQTYRFNSYLIASGSFSERIFIYKKTDNKVNEYNLKNCKFQLVREFDSLAKYKESITSIAFIKETEKLIYVIDQKQLFSKAFTSNLRAEMSQNSEDGKIVDVVYYKEKKLICIKNQKFIKIYSIHMQVVGKFSVLGTEFVAITTMQDFGYIVLVKDNLVIEVRMQMAHQEINRNSMMLTGKTEIKPCQFAMSKDNVYVMKSSSRYLEFVNKRFKVPDEEFFQERQPENFVPEAVLLRDTRSSRVLPGPVVIQPNINPPVFNSYPVLPSPSSPEKISNKLIPQKAEARPPSNFVPPLNIPKMPGFFEASPIPVYPNTPNLSIPNQNIPGSGNGGAIKASSDSKAENLSGSSNLSSNSSGPKPSFASLPLPGASGPNSGVPNMNPPVLIASNSNPPVFNAQNSNPPIFNAPNSNLPIPDLKSSAGSIGVPVTSPNLPSLLTGPPKMPSIPVGANPNIPKLPTNLSSDLKAPQLVPNGMPPNIPSGPGIPKNFSSGPGIPSNISSGAGIPSNIPSVPGMPSNMPSGPGMLPNLSYGPGIPPNMPSGPGVLPNLSSGPGMPPNMLSGPRIPSNLFSEPPPNIPPLPSNTALGPKITPAVSNGKLLNIAPAPGMPLNIPPPPMPGNMIPTLNLTEQQKMGLPPNLVVGTPVNVANPAQGKVLGPQGSEGLSQDAPKMTGIPVNVPILSQNLPGAPQSVPGMPLQIPKFPPAPPVPSMFQPPNPGNSLPNIPSFPKSSPTDLETNPQEKSSSSSSFNE